MVRTKMKKQIFKPEEKKKRINITIDDETLGFLKHVSKEIDGKENVSRAIREIVKPIMDRWKNDN